jgi:hypothetical protein
MWGTDRMIRMIRPRPANGPVSIQEWLILLITVVTIKLAWLLADHTLRLYMGDSMVYLQTGAWLSGSPGRSWLYGALLHFTAFPLRSPLAILLLQVSCSILSSLILFHFLRRALNLDFLVSLTAAALFSTEPAQLFFERMVMAETAGLTALVTMIAFLATYLSTGRLRWYVMSVLLGLASANFRTSLLPVVIGLGLTIPLVRCCLRSDQTAPPLRSGLKNMALALATLATLHLAYTHVYGYTNKCPPGYLALTGMMRIGLVAPLIQPEHFEGTGVSGDVLEQVELPLSDHWQRGSHIWSSNGLWHALEANAQNPEAVARTITRRAMLDHPLELLKINLETLGGYFDHRRTYHRMQDDIGIIPPDDYALKIIREWLDWDARGIHATETPARIYFAESGPWLTFCLFALAPLAMLALYTGWRRPQRARYVLLALASLGLVASHLLFAHIVSFRYLHPLPWFVLANLAALTDAVLSQRHLRATAVATAGKPVP